MTEDKKTETEPTKKVAPSKRTIQASELQLGSENSDAVRHLQRGLRIEETGTYDDTTRRAVQRWRLASELPPGRGTRVDREQASQIIGRDYTVVDE